MPPKPASHGENSGPSNGKGLQPQQGRAAVSVQASSQGNGSGAEGPAPKKKRNRGRKKANRRQSFAAPSDTSETPQPLAERPNLATVTENQPSSSFYRLGNRAAGSDTSLESEALLDHREQNRDHGRHPRPNASQSHQHPQASRSSPQIKPPQLMSRSERNNLSDSLASKKLAGRVGAQKSDENESDEGAPLIPTHRRSRPQSGYGITSRSLQGEEMNRLSRRRSTASSRSTRSRKRTLPRRSSTQDFDDDYDVNNPPSVPGSPRLGGDDEFDDVMLPEFADPQLGRRHPVGSHGGEVLIDIDEDAATRGSPSSPSAGGFLRRRPTGDTIEDVCLPFEQMTEIGEDEEEYMHRQSGVEPDRVHRRHRKAWPDLSVLEEWSHEEKEELKLEGIRAKKVDEPVLIGGRLRPQRGAWQREDREDPFRWTYFNDELDSSLRSHNISGLQQLGRSFRELFIPEPPELDDSSSESEDDSGPLSHERSATPSHNGRTSHTSTRQPTILDHHGFDFKPEAKLEAKPEARPSSGDHTPTKMNSAVESRPKKYGPRPVFWLDVLQPTWEEMKVLSRAFGIHKLTAEDIMEQEAREKVELFRNYYFVNYRTFEQDNRSEDYMDPVNMYFVVFKGGVISFHFSQMPHPPNVRRRIRQLAEHQYTDSDWIAYAIIDNITDAYAPLIEQIEEEVDDIDDEILLLHSKKAHKEDIKQPKWATKNGGKGDGTYRDDPSDKKEEDNSPPDTRRDMLLRVGECRKRVMGLYRLLGNKADVIKGLAKRCNEQWQVAPRSDVGLYLGDIQDHIVTMTGNLTHYESILSRAHSNYLAQINIGMNERAERTNDVLGKLTVLGTIVLPMNIVTGMWGMNCLVPGQVDDNPTYWWFFGLTTFLFMFGFTSFFVAKKVYKIV